MLHLSDLGSLVSAEDIGGSPYFDVLHASLYDFLTDPARSGALYVDPGLIQADIARGYLRILQQGHHLGEYLSVLSIHRLNWNYSESIGSGLPAFTTFQFPGCFSGAVITPELVADILSFRLSETLLSFGWWFFESISASLTEAIMNLVRFSVQPFVLSADVALISQGLPRKCRDCYSLSGRI